MDKEVITIAELAKRLNLTQEWVKMHLSEPRVLIQVSWKSFNSATDFYRVCDLMHMIGEPLYREPFLDDDSIVVRMSDDFAFIFDLNGKRV